MGPLLAALAILAAGGSAVVRYLASPAAPRRTTEAQAELEHAVAAVDRELAADLELMAMFDQTKKAFVLENGQFTAVRSVIEREAPASFVAVADVYERIPGTEAAMERRGPAGSIKDADRDLIHAWEGDAREAQRALRDAVVPSRATRWEELIARLRARFSSR